MTTTNTNEANHTIDAIEGEILPTNVPLKTAFAEVSILPNITETANFQQTLEEIPRHVDAANALLDGYRTNREEFVETVDEEQLSEQIKVLSSVSSFVKDIERSRREIKSYMNNKRDEVIQVLDARLEEARFGELSLAQSDLKQLKKDVEVDRRENRWAEIRGTFEANVNRYPDIAEHTPRLVDFSRFKMLFPKLVSGAKTRVVKEKDHTVVNETLYAWNEGLSLILKNEWNLSPTSAAQLLDLFQNDPSLDLVTREGRRLKQNEEDRERARIEAENRRIEAERQQKELAAKRHAEMLAIQEQERIAREARDKQAEERARQDKLKHEQETARLAEAERARQAEYAQFGTEYPKVMKESYPMFMEFLFADPTYRDVHTNPKTKANIIYNIMRQIESPDSVVSRETKGDAQTVLNLVQYILNA